MLLLRHRYRLVRRRVQMSTGRRGLTTGLVWNGEKQEVHTDDFICVLEMTCSAVDQCKSPSLDLVWVQLSPQGRRGLLDVSSDCPCTCKNGGPSKYSPLASMGDP